LGENFAHGHLLISCHSQSSCPNPPPPSVGKKNERKRNSVLMDCISKNFGS